MNPKEILESKDPDALLNEVMERIHLKGPIYQSDLNILATFKLFHADIFSTHEKKIMYLLGLFYKTDKPTDIISLLYEQYKKAIIEQTGKTLTPVQASIRRNIHLNKYFSFSAPTSAGKSYLLRDLLENEKEDVIIVVPSRALISEYLTELHDIFHEHPEVLILQFIDNINRKRTTQRVFVVTPERAIEAVKSDSLDRIGLVILDEAQISEEKSRGISFDTFVRRSDKLFPDAKKVFAHPFVENPEAQLAKHSFSKDSNSENYKQLSVGKIFVRRIDANRSFYFSPYLENGHLQKNSLESKSDIAEKTLKEEGQILIFVSKSIILKGEYKTLFKKYIDLCDPITDETAISIIDEVEELLGAKKRRSDLVRQMRCGIVIHHGSIPLVVRGLIERFTNLGFAKICFATSTLSQGVNMPFSIVWIHNLRFQGTKENRILGLKNLIGRAGRTTQANNTYDYGYVLVKNAKDFSSKINEKSYIDETSQLDAPHPDTPEEILETLAAINEGTMNDEYNLPQSKVERLSESVIAEAILKLLNLLFSDGKIISSYGYSQLNNDQRSTIKEAFALIFSNSINRQLQSGEKAVLSTAITIILMKIQGRSFKEILRIRHRYLTKFSEHKPLRELLKSGKITQKQYRNKLSEIELRYSTPPATLPDNTLTFYQKSSFGRRSVLNLRYDELVYDTYDYLDKVISYSLTDTFVAAFSLYYSNNGDDRSKQFSNYLRYGTSDTNEILLMRYGFTLDEIDAIAPHVHSIDENEIIFKDSVAEVDQSRALLLVKRYKA